MALFLLQDPALPLEKKLHCLATKIPVSKAVLVYLWCGMWRGSMGRFSLKCLFSKTAGPICARLAPNEREDNCFCENDLWFLIWCSVLEIYAIKVGQFGQNMVKKSTFSENMRTPVPLTPDGETTSTLHYFCLKLHHFASRMTPIDTHFFILIPSKTRFAKALMICDHHCILWLCTQMNE